MATDSSTLALKIPWTEELGAGYYPWGRKELGTTERLHFTSNINKTGNISYILRACCEMQILNTEFLNSMQTITKFLLK